MTHYPEPTDEDVQSEFWGWTRFDDIGPETPRNVPSAPLSFRPTPRPALAQQPELTEGQRKFLELLGWFYDRLDDPPRRIHQGFSTVWHDESGASVIGAPDLDPAFAALINGRDPKRVERFQVTCSHARLRDEDRLKGVLCPDCSTYDENGMPVSETGLYEGRRVLYVYPMRAAISSCRYANVKPGRPPLDVTLRGLAYHRWDLGAVAVALSRRWPAMGDPHAARRHFTYALHQVQRRFTEQPLTRFDPPTKSESQLDAEATIG